MCIWVQSDAYERVGAHRDAEERIRVKMGADGAELYKGGPRDVVVQRAQRAAEECRGLQRSVEERRGYREV